MTERRCTDPVILNQWHPLHPADQMEATRVTRTILLEEPLCHALDANGAPLVWPSAGSAPRLDGSQPSPLPARLAYGFLWACLGTPPDDLFPFPETAEPDRRNLATGTFGVHVSAGRAIENFLDMGHFPFVHTGILGEEPHTEVKEYDVEIASTRDEVLATRCRFYQPKAAASSTSGAEVEYIYRVPHINCAILYKSSPNDLERRDAIALFVQPVGPEQVIAHTFMSVLDNDSSDTGIRLFQQTIFGQDKPILENQFPRRLPLAPRAETPIRADKSSIAYRRWLSSKGLTYGVIPAVAE
ncbi:MAG: aromatic ring-hydroxylating dioxygenase subunit alpha [Rhodobacterales bacterium]|nr:aromatic ring-hydroxylating dioxygenase subunit alpha [Rhodobacterales bacterium]